MPKDTVMPVYLSVDKFVVILFSASHLSTMSNHITIRVDKDYRRYTATSFSRFQHEKKFWDCKIMLGSETLYCHSYVVSSMSPVIEEMIDTKIRDGYEKEITFDNIHPDVMRKITNYMYTGSVNISKNLVVEVVQVCDELKIEDLKERCLYRVPEILSPQTAISWLKYARKHSLDSICESCERYISYSFSDIGKEKFLIRCSLDELKSTLQDLKGLVSPENLLTSVLSWINYDKKSRKTALDYTLDYLELKECGKQFLTDSSKTHIDIFQSNPEFNRRVTHILQPRKLTVVLIGGALSKGGESYYNTKVWNLGSETHFDDITQIVGGLPSKGPSICYYDWNKLIFTGGQDSDVCVMVDMSTKKWKKMKNLKRRRRGQASVCILQQLFIFGGDISMRKSNEFSTSVEYLNIEQEHGVWQSAPPMPSALVFPRITYLDTNVYLMGEKNPFLYLFDAMTKVWSQKSEMPRNPRRGFSIAAGNGSLYVAGGEMMACWKYIISTDSWAKLSSPALMHAVGALIFNQNSLLLLGGYTQDIEGYATKADKWAVAPYKLPERLAFHKAFMMDLGEWTIWYFIHSIGCFIQLLTQLDITMCVVKNIWERCTQIF